MKGVRHYFILIMIMLLCQEVFTVEPNVQLNSVIETPKSNKQSAAKITKEIASFISNMYTVGNLTVSNITVTSLGGVKLLNTQSLVIPVSSFQPDFNQKNVYFSDSTYLTFVSYEVRIQIF